MERSEIINELATALSKASSTRAGGSFPDPGGMTRRISDPQRRTLTSIRRHTQSSSDGGREDAPTAGLLCSCSFAEPLSLARQRRAARNRCVDRRRSTQSSATVIFATMARSSPRASEVGPVAIAAARARPESVNCFPVAALSSGIPAASSSSFFDARNAATRRLAKCSSSSAGMRLTPPGLAPDSSVAWET